MNRERRYRNTDQERMRRLVGERPTAKALGLSGLFWLLYDKFAVAGQPLSFVARHYLAQRKPGLFGDGQP